MPYIQTAPISLSSSLPSGKPGVSTVFLSVDPSLNYQLYNGGATDEGYHFQVTPHAFVIKGSAPIGVWWGTRTFLQQAVVMLAEGANTVSFSAGTGYDSPGWEVRGFMLDAGRHWFDTSFLSKSPYPHDMQ